MLNPDGVVSEGLTPLNSGAKQELEYWKHLLFEFDMDGKNTNHPHRQSSGSTADKPENSNIARAISLDVSATVGSPANACQIQLDI